jgi:protoporphyrinogen oxidase
MTESRLIKTDVLILGGGLAGLSTAYHLNQSSNLSSLIVEKETQAGGTAGSIFYKGFTFDFTGHLLHLHDPYGKKLISNFLRGNIHLHKRNSWIYSHNVFTRYPFQANTYGLPDKVIDDCLVGFLKTVHSPPKAVRGDVSSSQKSFREWALSTFGEGICRYFLFPYNEKLWQRPLSTMTTEWQGRFVPAPKSSEVLYGALMDQTKAFGYNATFRYPKRGGIQALPNAFVHRLKAGQICLQSPLLSLDLDARIATVKGLGKVSFNHLVNTIPLIDFLALCSNLPKNVVAASNKLSYNSVYCLNLGVSGSVMPGKHWIYFSEKKFPFYRVGFYNQFSRGNAPRNSSSLYVEFSRDSKKTVDLAALERLAIQSLKRSGIISDKNKILAKLWVPIRCAYVVYDFNRKPALDIIFPYLDGKNIFSIGRYGAWKYSFMEEAILDGKNCAETIGRS